MPGTTAIEMLAADQRVALGAAGLRTFFRAADAWGLSVAEQRGLLGDVSRSALDAWRRQAPAAAGAYSTDLLTRLSYLLGIYGALRLLYNRSPAFADAWVGAVNHGPPFGGQSPAAFMRAGGVPAMHHVRRLLEAQAGGGLAPACAGPDRAPAGH